MSSGLMLAVVALVVATLLLTRLDAWQRVYAAMITLLVLAASSVDSFTSMAYYLRFVAAATLAVLSWRGRTEAVKLASLPRPTERLVKGMWWVAIVATMSIVWSLDRPETITQSIVIVVFAAILHGVVTSRWVSEGVMAEDFRIGFWSLTGAFVVSIAMVLADVPEAFVYGGRIRGIFSNPNLLGCLSAISIPLGVALLRYYRHRWRYLAGISVAVATLLMSESRTGLVAVGVGLAWVALRSRPVRIINVLYFATLAGAIIAIIMMVSGTPLPDISVLSRFSANEGGDLLNARDVAWDQAWTEFTAAPIGGIGYGATPSVFSDRISSGVLAFGSVSVHSSYLQWLMELGLIGVVPMLAVLAATISAAVKTRMTPLSLGLAWVAITGFTIQFSESVIFGTGQPYPYIYWLAVAGLTLAVSVSPPTDRRRATRRDRQVRTR